MAKKVHLEVDNPNFQDPNNDNHKAGICGTGQNRWRDMVWGNGRYVPGPHSTPHKPAILTKDRNQVTCKSCLQAIEKKRKEAFDLLAKVIDTRVLTKQEYLTFWDEVVVTQVMEG
jgi:hypothetical protein